MKPCIHRKQPPKEKLRRKTGLVLAASLWIAGNGIANAGWGGSICLNANDNDSLLVSATDTAWIPNDAVLSHQSRTMCITGGDWSEHTWYFGSGRSYRLGTPIDGYRLVMHDMTGATNVYGGSSQGTADATGNIVELYGSTVTGRVDGGLVNSDGDATGNTVRLTDSHAANVYGGHSMGGNATGNFVFLKNSSAGNVYGGFAKAGKDATGNLVVLDHATVTGQLCGGNSSPSGTDPWNGNILVLAGTGNAASGSIRNFDTIRLGASLQWKPGTTVLRFADLADWGKRLDISRVNFSHTLAPGKMVLLLSDGADGNDLEGLGLICPDGLTVLDTETPRKELYRSGEKTSLENNVSLAYRTVHAVSLETAGEQGTHAVSYIVSNKVHTVSFGDIFWRKNGTARSLRDVSYDLSEAVIDTSGLGFTNPDEIAAGTSMNLLSGVGAMHSLPEREETRVPYFYRPVSGVSISGHIEGDVSPEGDAIAYHATANRADRISFESVPWLDSGSLLERPVNISFDGATIDTSSIYFNNVASLRANQQMVLISDFDGVVGEVTGTTYTVGTTLTGKGKASQRGTDIIYTVETESRGNAPAVPDKKSGGSSADRGVPPADRSNASRDAKSSASGNQPAANGTPVEAETEKDTAAKTGALPSRAKDVPILTAQEQTHNVVMGMEAGMTALAAGNDFIGKAVEEIAESANCGADGISVYAGMGGGTSRQETGSHVRANTWNGLIAIGTQKKLSDGIWEWGGFVEQGAAHFSLHGGTGCGSGSSVYTGGGALCRWTNSHEVYTEASFRMGKVHDSASDVLRDAAGKSYGYDVRADYCGGHLGLGRLYRFDGGKTVDIYGKFFVTKRGGVSFDAGGHYELDGVTSNVLRVGARYTAAGEKWKWYSGLAYEYEFDGESSGTADGAHIRSASTKGGSALAEFGIRMEPDGTSPWKLDIGIQGHFGKHRGIDGSLTIGYLF